MKGGITFFFDFLVPFTVWELLWIFILCVFI